jgi:hypothetical protein
MATVERPKTAKALADTGAVAFWTAYRVLRSTVIAAMAKVGATQVPPVDHYDALVETGKNIVDAANLRQRKCPIKADSLSRSGVGVEFYQTIKGDKQNQRESLFSLAVDKAGENDQVGTVRVVAVGVNPSLAAFFAKPNVQQVIQALYEKHLQYMPSRDVTDALVGLVNRSKGVPMKDTGGVYFVPDVSISTVDTVFHALNAAGCRCTLLIQDLENNTELVKQVLDATNDKLLREIGDMNDAMQDILDNDKLPRGNGMATRKKQLAQFAELAAYYEQQFGANLDAAREGMAKAHELLAELELRKQQS